MAKQGSRKAPASDTTGKKAEALKKEHAKELEERAKEMALVAEAEAERNENEVIDLAVFPQGMPGVNTRQATDPNVTVDDAGYMTVEGRQSAVKTNDTEVIGMGPETPFDVPGSTPEFEVERRIVDTENAVVQGMIAEKRPVTQVIDQGQQMVEFRVNETLEDVTIGVGNTFTFEEGRKYRAPAFVRDHLEEKGFIWH